MSRAIAKLKALHAAATQPPWAFTEKEHVDLLTASVEGNDEAVLFYSAIGDDEKAANWALIPEMRNALPALLACAEALKPVAKCIYDGHSSGECAAKFPTWRCAGCKASAALAALEKAVGDE